MNVCYMGITVPKRNLFTGNIDFFLVFFVRFVVFTDFFCEQLFIIPDDPFPFLCRTHLPQKRDKRFMFIQNPVGQFYSSLMIKLNKYQEFCRFSSIFNHVCVKRFFTVNQALNVQILSNLNDEQTRGLSLFFLVQTMSTHNCC